MKLHFCLLLIGLASAACSQPSNEPDLGIPPGDLAARADSGAASDLGTPGDLTTSPVTGTTLNLVAGALGGSGNIDGVARAARFYYPAGLALDGAGNLYVADYLNYTIRKIVLATGAVSTIAGTPGQPGPSDGTGAAAHFNEPSGLTTDGAGNLNGDYGSAYIGRLTPTCRRPNHDAYL
jgi:sugar lactone lactonase YvrE